MTVSPCQWTLRECTNCEVHKIRSTKQEENNGLLLTKWSYFRIWCLCTCYNLHQPIKNLNHRKYMLTKKITSLSIFNHWITTWWIRCSLCYILYFSYTNIYLAEYTSKYLWIFAHLMFCDFFHQHFYLISGWLLRCSLYYILHASCTNIYIFDWIYNVDKMHNLDKIHNI